MNYTSWRRLFPKFLSNPPADSAALQRLEEAKLPLPSDYIEFLSEINGGEGWVDDVYLVIWKAEELINLNAAYSVSTFVPNFFLFGSNGGDDALAFCYAQSEVSVVRVPFIGMESKNAIKLADSFEQFIEILPNLDL